jgi:hypothetical protein
MVMSPAPPGGEGGHAHGDDGRADVRRGRAIEGFISPPLPYEVKAAGHCLLAMLMFHLCYSGIRVPITTLPSASGVVDLLTWRCGDPASRCRWWGCWPAACCRRCSMLAAAGYAEPSWTSRSRLLPLGDVPAGDLGDAAGSHSHDAFLGEVLFTDRPRAGKIARDYWRSLPQWILYQACCGADAAAGGDLFVLANWPYLSEVILLSGTRLAAPPRADDDLPPHATLHGGYVGDLLARWLGDGRGGLLSARGGLFWA